MTPEQKAQAIKDLRDGGFTDEVVNAGEDYGMTADQTNRVHWTLDNELYSRRILAAISVIESFEEEPVS